MTFPGLCGGCGGGALYFFNNHVLSLTKPIKATDHDCLVHPIVTEIQIG
jgi:hypothetical protein